MREVNHRVAVVGHDGVVEDERANPPPVPERAAQPERRSRRLAFVGDLDGKRQGSLRRWIATIEDLGHDLVAHVEIGAGNHRLLFRDEQPHELRRPRRLAGRLPKLRNRVELAHGALLVHPPEDGGDPDQDRSRCAAAEHGDVGCVPKFSHVDRVAPRAADVLLRDEVRGSERRGVIRIRCRKELADERQRSDPAAKRTSPATRVAGHDERRSAAREVTRVRRVFSDLPAPDEADAVGMKQTREAFAIRSPAKVGAGVERPRGGTFKVGSPATLEQPAEDASDRLVLDWQRRFARATPHGLIGIREQRIHDFAETRAGVPPVFVVELFRADDQRRQPNAPPVGHYTAATLSLSITIRS